MKWTGVLADPHLAKQTNPRWGCVSWQWHISCHTRRNATKVYVTIVRYQIPNTICLRTQDVECSWLPKCHHGRNHPGIFKSKLCRSVTGPMNAQIWIHSRRGYGSADQFARTLRNIPDENTSPKKRNPQNMTKSLSFRFMTGLWKMMMKMTRMMTAPWF